MLCLPLEEKKLLLLSGLNGNKLIKMQFLYNKFVFYMESPHSYKFIRKRHSIFINLNEYNNKIYCSVSLETVIDSGKNLLVGKIKGNQGDSVLLSLNYRSCYKGSFKYFNKTHKLLLTPTTTSQAMSGTKIFQYTCL